MLLLVAPGVATTNGELNDACGTPWGSIDGTRRERGKLSLTRIVKPLTPLSIDYDFLIPNGCGSRPIVTFDACGKIGVIIAIDKRGA